MHKKVASCQHRGSSRNELPEQAQGLVAREQEPGLSLKVGHRIGLRVGVQPDPLGGWCREADIDAGRSAGTTTAEAVKIKEFGRENRELKRANETSHAAGGSTRGSLWSREGEGFVVAGAGGRAAVQAAQESVEQVALRGGVPVTGGAASVVVLACAGRFDGRRTPSGSRSRTSDRADKTGCTKCEGPWKGADDLELATLGWVVAGPRSMACRTGSGSCGRCSCRPTRRRGRKIRGRTATG